jgi:hypothetical protein
MKTTIGLTEFALKVTTLSMCLMKRQMSRGEELEEASKQSQRSLFKNLIRPPSMQDR